MEFGVCPECKVKARRHWFKAFCDRCNVQLKESGATHAILVFVPIIGLAIAMYIGKQGTTEILAQNPPELSNVLFRYYVSILVVIWLATGFINYVVRNYFSIYKTTTHNQ